MSRRISFSRDKVSDIPEGIWIAHGLQLLQSKAWSGQSIYCKRFMEFLEIEHMKHGNAENVHLLAPRRQLIEWGIHPAAISKTIDEAKRRGLIYVKPGLYGGSARNNPSLYRITYLKAKVVNKDGTYYFSEPTNDWRLFDGDKVKFTAPAQKRYAPSKESKKYLMAQLRDATKAKLALDGDGADKALADNLGISAEHLRNFLGGHKNLHRGKMAKLIEFTGPTFKGTKLNALLFTEEEAA